MSVKRSKTASGTTPFHRAPEAPWHAAELFWMWACLASGMFLLFFGMEVGRLMRQGRMDLLSPLIAGTFSFLLLVFSF